MNSKLSATTPKTPNKISSKWRRWTRSMRPDQSEPMPADASRLVSTTDNA